MLSLTGFQRYRWVLKLTIVIDRNSTDSSQVPGLKNGQYHRYQFNITWAHRIHYLFGQVRGTPWIIIADYQFTGEIVAAWCPSVHHPVQAYVNRHKGFAYTIPYSSCPSTKNNSGSDRVSV